MGFGQLLKGSVILVPSVSAHSSNDVFFDSAGSVSFKETSHSIGNSGDWGGISWSDDHLTVSADRHGSGGPAQDFKQDLGPGNMIGDRVSKDDMPQDLNFAIFGTLSMNANGVMISCPDIRIGQGHTGSNNNWWMAGKNCMADGSSAGGTLSCVCNNGANLKFSTVGGKSDHFHAELVDRCGVISRRSGAWVPITAAAGEKVSFEYDSSSTDYTETDFMQSLTAEFSAPFEFGSLKMTAEESTKYVHEITTSSSWKKDCSVTVPDGKRLWQWKFGVSTNCGDNFLHSCYFFDLPISAGPPCCLVGYQSEQSTKCTAPGKNMCSGNETAHLLV